MSEKASTQLQFKMHTFSTDNSDYHVLLLEHSGKEANPQVAILVEPFTWAWVGIKICEGIIADIGGKIFDQMIGAQGLTKQDLKDILTQFISVIAMAVKQQLELNDKRQIEASAASLQSLFDLYLTNKDTSYLTPLVFKADELAHQATSFQLLTVPCFGIVGSIELAVLQEVYLVKKTAENKKTISVKAKALVNDSQTYHSALVDYNNSRFGAIQLTGRKKWRYPLPYYGPPFHGIHDPPNYLWPTSEYGYVLDGQLQGWNQNWSQQQANTHRQLQLDQEFARLEKEILYPLYAVVDQWTKIEAANA